MNVGFPIISVKVLNGAHLDASIHQRGELKGGRNWPSPWCLGSGILLAIAFFKYLYEPMHWVALGAVAVGVPPIVVKAIAALRKFFLDINILMLIAGNTPRIGLEITSHSVGYSPDPVYCFALSATGKESASYIIRKVLCTIS